MISTLTADKVSLAGQIASLKDELRQMEAKYEDYRTKHEDLRVATAGERQAFTSKVQAQKEDLSRLAAKLAAATKENEKTSYLAREDDLVCCQI